MDSASPGRRSDAQDFARIVRRAAESRSIKSLAIDTSIDASLLGKFLGRGGTLSLDDVGRVLNALDKRVVPLTARCVDAERLRAMTSLFVATVRDEQSFERLVWDEDQ